MFIISLKCCFAVAFVSSQLECFNRYTSYEAIAFVISRKLRKVANELYEKERDNLWMRTCGSLNNEQTKQK